MINITTRAKDAYTWKVTYADGSTVDEYDEDRPDGRGFLEVNTAPIKMLTLSDIHRVVIPEGATPVFFRRRPTIVFQGDDTPDISVKHCIGWKKDEQAVYLFIREDGSTLLSSDLQAV